MSGAAMADDRPCESQGKLLCCFPMAKPSLLYCRSYAVAKEQSLRVSHKIPQGLDSCLFLGLPAQYTMQYTGR